MHKLYNLLLPSLLTVVLSCASSCKEKTDCTQFKNGAFILHYKGQQGDISFSIHRKDSIQIETDPKTGNTTKLLIRWKDKCNYEAWLLETTFTSPDSLQKARKKVPLKVKILNWTNDYYFFRAEREGSNYIMTDTMWIEK